MRPPADLDGRLLLHSQSPKTSEKPAMVPIEISFNEPKFVFRMEWRPEHNGTGQEFAFKDAERHSLVHYRLEFDGGEARI